MQKIQASVQVECAGERAGKDSDEILVRVQVTMQ